ncbi:hypothetical protein BJY00DRAFT_274974 [Aspergillus carlsbadensis]|nr:hypothetical protein BJY00DRAFT_274974 [Aspergillus carlsbadensis]
MRYRGALLLMLMLMLIPGTMVAATTTYSSKLPELTVNRVRNTADIAPQIMHDISGNACLLVERRPECASNCHGYLDWVSVLMESAGCARRRGRDSGAVRSRSLGRWIYTRWNIPTLA